MPYAQSGRQKNRVDETCACKLTAGIRQPWRKPSVLEGLYQSVVHAPFDEQISCFVYHGPVALVCQQLRVTLLNGREVLIVRVPVDSTNMPKSSA